MSLLFFQPLLGPRWSDPEIDQPGSSLCPRFRRQIHRGNRRRG